MKITYNSLEKLIKKSRSRIFQLFNELLYADSDDEICEINKRIDKQLSIYHCLLDLLKAYKLLNLFASVLKNKTE